MSSLQPDNQQPLRKVDRPDTIPGHMQAKLESFITELREIMRGVLEDERGIELDNFQIPSSTFPELTAAIRQHMRKVRSEAVPLLQGTTVSAQTLSDFLACETLPCEQSLLQGLLAVLAAEKTLLQHTQYLEAFHAAQEALESGTITNPAALEAIEQLRSMAVELQRRNAYRDSLIRAFLHKMGNIVSMPLYVLEHPESAVRLSNRKLQTSQSGGEFLLEDPETMSEDAIHDHQMTLLRQSYQTIIAEDQYVTKLVALSNIDSLGEFTEYMKHRLQTPGVTIRIAGGMQARAGNVVAAMPFSNLSEALQELVLNAKKSYRGFHRRPDIHVTFDFQHGNFLCTVQDTGKGMYAHQVKKVFSKESYTTTESTGQGINEMLADLRLAGGNLRCRSWKWHGTTFVLKVPCHEKDKN